MILAVGEILADMIGDNENENLTFKAFCGGAPFNVAVNAKMSGSTVGFIGRVGYDVIGRFLCNEAKKAGLDYLDIQIDKQRNTTLAFVTLSNGERDFAFNRHDTADYNVDFDEIDFSKYGDLKIIHLGSLMLSEKNGRDLARKIANKAKELGVKLSFDMNFRMDTYENFNDAIVAYKPYVERADIIKFSEDELKLYTGIDDIKSAIESIYQKDQLFLLTLGSKGSLYYYNGMSGVVPTKKVTPIDTTGAGDAFFGTLLSCLENQKWTEQNIQNALEKANEQGAKTTQFLGAIKL
ncbi:MAG: carbohydrate kinase [Clostridiales bacterium]|nr:carbohydrate kinase [Clostridiales bacterium]